VESPDAHLLFVAFNAELTCEPRGAERRCSEPG